MNGYLIRLDDACETMNSVKWNRIENILDKYNIKPIVGIIPSNKDKSLIYEEKDEMFWSKVQFWKKKGWIIALHGYDHVYLTEDGGINPIHKRSEFAGISFEKQKEKIKKGYNILKNKNLNPEIFFAPSHTFDLNTINSLLDETDIKIISDTFSLRPYKYQGINFLPQQFGKVRRFPIGIITFCYHPNEMKEEEFEELEKFINKNFKRFLNYEEVKLDDLKERNLLTQVLGKIYFLLRKMKGKING